MTAASGLETIDKTIHKTNLWLKEIEEELGWDDRHRAFQALRAVLRTLRDRLPVQEGAHLAGQLPTLIRGVFYENWNPSAVPDKELKGEGFLDRIPEYFPGQEGLDPERIVRAVFRVLEKHVSRGELDDVRANFPKDLKNLLEAAKAD